MNQWSSIEVRCGDFEYLKNHNKFSEPRWFRSKLGFDSRSREKTGTTETRIFHVLTFTVGSVVRKPLETVGPVVRAGSVLQLSIGFANKLTPLEYKHVHNMAYRSLSWEPRPLKYYYYIIIINFHCDNTWNGHWNIALEQFITI